jgi:lipoprotein-anchoring transpeptidase ErfK/SrfK
VRALRILGLALIITATGLLGGGAGDVAPTLAPAPAMALPAAAAPAVVAGPALAPQAILAAAPPVPAAVPVLKPSTEPAPKPLPKPPPKPTAKPKPPAMVAGTPCRANASACVDLSANRAWLISDGTVQYGPVPITHGRKGFRTPPGTFRVSFKAADHVSSIYDAEMPYSVFFNGGIAFHQGSLKVLSHGCVHLSGKAAKNFFGALGRGEIVQVMR